MSAKTTRRGGSRANAGRKKDPLKDIRIGAATAQKILKELNHEREIPKLYRECGDARLKVQILFRLRDSAYGRPGQSSEEQPGKTAPTVNVIIRGIGAGDHPSAKAN